MVDPQIAAAIRAGIDKLDKLGADNFADYWCDELHQVNGYPIKRRWNSLTLAQIEKDVLQISGETGEYYP
jgi:hypothetical protein